MSVLVAQQQSFRESRLRRLRVEALALDSTVDSGHVAPVNGSDSDRDTEMTPPRDDDTENIEVDMVFFGAGADLGRETDAGGEDDGDPFEGRPDSIFLEDSDEEDEPIGSDFQAAPWLQGLSARECLEEVFNVDAAQRGKSQRTR
ncbi:hypothetical protein FB451DRAFT_1163397 [Mycena latifolia]|nr:hypothetical protein FB451DRAFT_1163397 [Mycena latifolia]